MKDHAFLKHAVVYGVANMLVRAGSFLLVPLYLHVMSQAENGIVEVLDRLVDTVGTVLLINGMRQALFTFYQQTTNEGERRRIYSSIMLLVLGFSVVLGGAILLGAQPLTQLLATDNGSIPPNLLRLVVLAILLEPLSSMPMALIQSRIQSGRYLLISVSQFFVRVLISFLLVGWFGLGAWGVFLAIALTSTAYGIVLTTWELVHSGAWPSRSHLLALLRFALPFLPGGVGFLVMQHGDRFFLLKYWGEETVATYGLGYKLALAVGMFSLGPLYMVWSSSMYEVARSPTAPEIFGRAFTRILAAYVYVGLGLCVFRQEIVRFLGGAAAASYAHAADIIVVVVLAGFFQTAAGLMDAGFYVSRRSGLKLGITLSSTAVMLVLYGVLIPTYGSMGAALATLGGFAFLAVATWIVSQRIFPVRYEWTRLASLVAFAGSAWLVSRSVPATLSWAPVKGALLLSIPLLAWLSELISVEEKTYLISLLSLMRERFPWLLARQRGSDGNSAPRIVDGVSAPVP